MNGTKRVLLFMSAAAFGGAGWGIVLAVHRPPDTQIRARSSRAIVDGVLTAGDVRWLQLLAQKKTDERRQALIAWAETADFQTIAEVLERVQLLLAEELRSEISRCLLTSWADRDLSAMGEWFGGRAAADSLHQDSRDVLVVFLTRLDSKTAAVWLKESLPPEVNREIFGHYFRARAVQEPREVGTQLLALWSDASEDRPFWNDLIGQLVCQWGGSNFGAAVAWVQALQDGEAKTTALLQLGAGWTRHAPAEAAAYASSRNDLQLVGLVSENWAQRDPGAALAWASGLPCGQMHDCALAAVIKVFADEDTALAATAVEALLPGLVRDRSLLIVAERYAEQSPRAAISWINRLTEGSLRDQCVGRLSAIWSSSDPEGADEWLRSLPNGPTRDVAIDAFVSVTDKISPGHAFEWASKINGLARRNQSLERAALTWLRIDPRAAVEPVFSSMLPAPIKKQMLSSLER